MSEPVVHPEPDGSVPHVTARPTVFRPGFFVAAGLVGAIWASGLGLGGRGSPRRRQALEQVSPRFVLALLLVLTLASVWAVLRVVLTKVVVSGNEVVVGRPFRRSVRFIRGAATAAGPKALVGPTATEAVVLPTWWLLTADVERLLASVESALGVRFPPGSRARPAGRRRRGDVRW